MQTFKDLVLKNSIFKKCTFKFTIHLVFCIEFFTASFVLFICFSVGLLILQLVFERLGQDQRLASEVLLSQRHDLDALRHVGHKHGDRPLQEENQRREADDKRQPRGQHVPMHAGVVVFIFMVVGKVEALVPADRDVFYVRFFRHIFGQELRDVEGGQGEVDVAVEGPAPAVTAVPVDHAGDEVRREPDQQGVGAYCDNGQSSQNVVPYSDGGSPTAERPFPLRDELVGVQAHLQDTGYN